MKALIKECKDRLGDDLAIQRLENELRVASRRLAQARENKRAELLARGADDSEDETSIYQTPLQAEAVYTSPAKYACIESELVSWNRLFLEDVESPRSEEHTSNSSHWE